jgi:hypothetical protein
MAREQHLYFGVTEQSKAAKHRWDDAQALLAAGRWRGAMYLAGYAVECLLKATLMRRFGCRQLAELEEELRRRGTLPGAAPQMVDAQLKERIFSVLRRTLFDDPADVIDVSDGDDVDDIHLVVISRKLEGRRLRERTDLSWDELQRDLTPEEWGRISLTIGVTPDQVNGASIHDLKVR